MMEPHKLPTRLLQGLRRVRLGWLLLAGSLLLGAWVLASIARHQGWGRPSMVARFRTTNAAGIWPGVFVTISGYRVGRVERVTLGPSGTVAVDLRIDSRFRRLIGPESRAFRTQESMLGDVIIGLTPDVTPAEREPPAIDLLLPYDPGTDVPGLLSELAETRLQLDRTLQSAARVVEKDVPRVIESFDATMQGARRLSGTLESTVPPTARKVDTALEDVGRLARRVEKETTPTAQAARSTLDTYRRSGEAMDLTAREVRDLTATVNRLLRSLGGAFLLQEGQPAAPPSAAEGPEGE